MAKKLQKLDIKDIRENIKVTAAQLMILISVYNKKIKDQIEKNIKKLNGDIKRIANKIDPQHADVTKLSNKEEELGKLNELQQELNNVTLENVESLAEKFRALGKTYSKYVNLTEVNLAILVSARYKKCGFKSDIHQSKISRLENAKSEFDLQLGLAVAHELGGLYLASFIDENILKCGRLQTDLLSFGTCETFESLFKNFEYMKKFESNEGRTTIFNVFPSIIFFYDIDYKQTITNKTIISDEESEKIRSINRDRYNAFLKLSESSKTKEYYSVDSVLNFSLSPFTLFSVYDKKTILKRVAKLFRVDGNSLHFFCELSYPNTFANLMINNKKNLILLDMPLGISNFLEVYNPELITKIQDFLENVQIENDQKILTFSNSPESIQFIEAIIDVIGCNTTLEQKIKALYEHNLTSSTLRFLMKPYIQGVIGSKF